jgi:hypothetical protein
MTKKRLTTHEAAKFLNLCVQRVGHKIDQGHFPNADWCECGRSRMIPIADLEKDKKVNPARKYTKGDKNV